MMGTTVHTNIKRPIRLSLFLLDFLFYTAFYSSLFPYCFILFINMIKRMMRMMMICRTVMDLLPALASVPFVVMIAP